MTKKFDVFKCNICGAMHQSLHDGAGDPVCCEKPMVRMKDNYVDAAIEKHVPVIKKIDGGKIEVNVGAVDHPMTDEHYIEWIELREGNILVKKFLNPGDRPMAVFSVEGEDYEVRAYCNLHGLWKA